MLAAPRFDPDHPRPTRQRVASAWSALDGAWEFHLDRDACVDAPRDVEWDATIVVPFAPETAASGLRVDGYVQRVWYRRVVETAVPVDGARVLVHFGAVDRTATVWANGEYVGGHIGGSTPFTVDVTAAAGTGSVELVVRADDDPHDLTVPRGKQDWEPEPHAIFYPRTTGIWQRVWVEYVPACRVAEVTWTVDGDSLRVEVAIEGEAPPNAWLELAVHTWAAADEQPRDRALQRERFALRAGRARQRVRRVIDFGIDDPERLDALRWWPHDPNLIAAAVGIVTDDGTVIDDVATYTGLRTVAVEGGRITVNGYPTPMRLALDQGYWPDSGMTAPDGDALLRDVELAQALGLNGVRKHQKIEDPRLLFWADRRGLLVWEEQPSAYQHGRDTLATLVREWSEAIARDRNHPCIVVWVPINETWGAVDRPHAIAALAELTAALDPTRLVSANDGWETLGGDLVGVHDYTNDADGFVQRYATAADVDETLRRRRPSAHRITLDGSGAEGRAVVVSEFGGLTFADDPTVGFGYGSVGSVEEFLDRYGELCRTLNASRGIAGWCWTQLTDTYQEANGLLRMDRTPKAPLDDLRLASLGLRPAR